MKDQTLPTRLDEMREMKSSYEQRREPSPKATGVAEWQIPKAELGVWAWDWERPMQQREHPQPDAETRCRVCLDSMRPPAWLEPESTWGLRVGKELRPKWEDLECLPEFGLNF